jgi:hypothetical protein
VAGPRQVWTGKMSDEREFSVVDVSKLSQVTLGSAGPSI